MIDLILEKYNTVEMIRDRITIDNLLEMYESAVASGDELNTVLMDPGRYRMLVRDIEETQLDNLLGRNRR